LSCIANQVPAAYKAAAIHLHCHHDFSPYIGCIFRQMLVITLTTKPRTKAYAATTLSFRHIHKIVKSDY
jgi:hypothetical protein